MCHVVVKSSRSLSHPLMSSCYTTWKGSPSSQMWFFVQLCSSWQDFNWLKASLGPSAIDELLVWVPKITYSQDANTDINAKYVKRRGSAQGCLLGVAGPYFNIYTPFSPQTAILGPDLDGRNFRPKNSFNIRGAKSKRPLNVIAATHFLGQ